METTETKAAATGAVVAPDTAPRSTLPALPTASWPVRLRGRRKSLAAVAAIALGAACLLRNAVLGSPVPVYVVQSGALTQTVVASGRVTTPARVAVGAEITGRVARIPVAEGQRVQAGALLIQLEDRDQRAAVAQALAARVQAQAHLQSIRDYEFPVARQTLAQALADAQQAREHLERAQQLRAQGYIGQAELDDVRTADDNALARVSAASLQVAAKQPGGSDVVLAQAALAQAQAGLVLAQAALAHTRVHAAAAGTLVAREVEEGDVVQPGHELMALAVDGDTLIEAQIDEKNLSLLAPGQAARVSADAFAQRRFDAQLVYVNPGVDAARGSVEVKLRVPQPPAYLRQDMTVSVDLEVAQRAHALTVPADALREDGSGSWLLVLERGRAQRRAVRVGLRGQGRIEILDGVSAGEQVISPVAAPALKPGDRARAAGS
ncbi:MAG TPA: efflux RND transporter periplasmic adaptor subunit [Nevskiaceae bacterium]|nr:efflux RND transporter periplasmic adaptor subunit [Nevskiaceae bacterium]